MEDILEYWLWDLMTKHLSMRDSGPPEATRLCFQNIKGGASDLKFLASDSSTALLASTFNGDLVLYDALDMQEQGQISLDGRAYDKCPDLKYITSMRLHQGSLLSLDVSDNQEVVTADSGGDIKIVDIREGINELRKIEGDGIPANCVRYVYSNIAVASNTIKLFDLRDSSHAPVKIKNETGKYFQSIATHPNQRFLCSGSNDGNICVWDPRNYTMPITKHEWHKSHVWEMQFLPSLPDVVASCSSDCLAIVNYNSDRALAHDFGAKVRAQREKVQSLNHENFGLNSCDAHGPSGMVASAGDSGGVVLAKWSTPGGPGYIPRLK